MSQLLALLYNRFKPYFPAVYAVAIVAVLVALVYYVYYYVYLPKMDAAKFADVANTSPTNNEVTIYMFHVDWCPHCKTAKPEWEEIKAQYDGKTINGYHVIFTEINCTEETAEIEKMVDKYKIEGYPTIKLLKDGQVIEFDAKPTKSTLDQFLNTVL